MPARQSTLAAAPVSKHLLSLATLLFVLAAMASARGQADPDRFDELFHSLERGLVEFESGQQARDYRDQLQAVVPGGDPLRAHRMDLVRCYFDYDQDPKGRIELARRGLAWADDAGLVAESAHWLHCIAAGVEDTEGTPASVPYYRDALDRVLSIEDPYLHADAMIALAQPLSALGKSGEALSMLLEAQEHLRELGREQLAASLELDIGTIYRRIGRFERATEILLPLMERARVAGPAELTTYFSTLMQLGFTLDEQGEFEAALVRFDQALAAATVLEGPGGPGIAQLGRAWSLVGLGRHDDALDALEAATQDLDEAGQSVHDGMISLLRARALMGLGDTQEPLQLLASAAETPEIRDNARYMTLVVDSMAELYAQRGEHAQAYRMMREHQGLIDRLNEQLRSQQLIAVQGQLDARERTLELERLRGDQALRSVEIEALERTRRWQGLALVALAAIGLLLVGWGARQYRQNRQLALQASIDPLTRVANRRAFLHRGQQLFAQHRGTDRPLSVLGVDLDLFKQVNDRYGHAAGDEVLVAVAGRMQSLLRQGEILGRLGGEEFAVLLPDIGPGEARRVAERLRVGIEALDFSDIRTDLGVTVSIGAATLGGDSHDSLDALMETADRRLYRAKAAGRNRIEDTGAA